MNSAQIKAGITGQAGFLGSHLFNAMGLRKDRFARVDFDREWFADPGMLDEFVRSCDVIFHLAAVNRSSNQQVLLETNVELVGKLVASLERTGSRAHVLFSSSTQELRDNPYGKSKLAGRELLEDWARRTGGKVSVFVIPNVFGPFGKPFYNSVVATFCHQVCRGEEVRIETDSSLPLVYVGDVARQLLDAAEQARPAGSLHEERVRPSKVISVSELSSKISSMAAMYLGRGEIPSLDDPFDRDLFNTLLCFVDHGEYFPFRLTPHVDQRGAFVETVKLNSGGQVSFSTSKPGVTRGNHFHTRKAERFVVLKGKARIDLRKVGTKQVRSFHLDGNAPSFVDMPVWHTHNITNVGDEDLYTMFWINEHFDALDPDTYAEKV